MRRKDREVTDHETIDSILRSAQVAHIAITDPAAPAPYVLPLNYGYEWIDGSLRLYFHGAPEGRKVDLLQNGAAVGFCIDGNHRLLTDDEAQKTSFAYQSIIGTGAMRLLTDDEQKNQALGQLMLHLTGNSASFPAQVLHATAVFALDVTDFSAKQNLG